MPLLTSALLWTGRSLMDFIRHRPSYSITLWAFPRIHNAIGKSYFLIGQPCSAFELVIFTIEACGLCFHDAPRGWTYAFLNLCEPEIFHGSYSSGNSLGRCHTQLILIEKWMNGHALEKWESTLNFVFMPMDTMLILSWMLLLNPLWYKFLYLGFGLLQSWFRPCSPF